MIPSRSQITVPPVGTWFEVPLFGAVYAVVISRDGVGKHCARGEGVHDRDVWGGGILVIRDLQVVGDRATGYYLGLLGGVSDVDAEGNRIVFESSDRVRAVATDKPLVAIRPRGDAAVGATRGSGKVGLDSAEGRFADGTGVDSATADIAGDPDVAKGALRRWNRDDRSGRGMW